MNNIEGIIMFGGGGDINGMEARGGDIRRDGGDLLRTRNTITSARDA